MSRFRSPATASAIIPLDRVRELSARGADWKRIPAEIDPRQVRIVALDLPTSWMLLYGSKNDFSGRMLAAINGMMLDMLTAIAHKDHEDQRRRQTEAQTKAAGKYPGRPEDTKRNAATADCRAVVKFPTSTKPVSALSRPAALKTDMRAIFNKSSGAPYIDNAE